MLDEDPGFILAHWDGTPETEEKIKTETKATIRCIPLEREEEPGTCMVTGNPSAGRVLFARAYLQARKFQTPFAVFQSKIVA